jgi:hypothetical protein
LLLSSRPPAFRRVSTINIHCRSGSGECRSCCIALERFRNQLTRRIATRCFDVARQILIHHSGVMVVQTASAGLHTPSLHRGLYCIFRIGGTFLSITRAKYRGSTERQSIRQVLWQWSIPPCHPVYGTFVSTIELGMRGYANRSILQSCRVLHDSGCHAFVD